MASPLGDFAAKVLSAVRAHGWAAPGAGWVAATSGGPDSTALAAALAELAAAGEIEIRLALAHFDHAIRPDSAEDAEWVGRLATRLRAVFLTERGDVPALAEREGLGIEEAARKARLAFLERAARRFGAARVATGHTADDQAETVLFRLMRGTGIRGLAGIPVERPISPESPEVLLVRPMLGVTREEVLAYLAEQGFEHLTDPTNRDTANQARARIRHEVLPELEERWRAVGGWRLEVGGSGANTSPPPTRNLQPPTARNALLSLAQSAARAQALLARVAERCLEGAEIGPGEARLPLWLLTLPPVLRTEAFAQAAERLGAPRPVPSGGLARMAAILEKTAVGARAEARGLVAERGYDCVVLQRVTSPQRRRERGEDAENSSGFSAFGIRPSERQRAGWTVPVIIPGETKLPAGKLVARIVDRRDFDLAAFVKSKTPLSEVFDARLFQPPRRQDTKNNDGSSRNNDDEDSPSAPLCILCGERALVCRTRRPGDRFRPFGSAGEKKLKAFLIDRKLPRREREQLPLLVLEQAGDCRLETGGRGKDDGSLQPAAYSLQPAVLWVVGVRLSESARVPPDAEKLVVMEYVPEGGPKAEGRRRKDETRRRERN